MQKEAGSPVQPREVYIRDLTDEMLFSLVRLRDVEIAMPYGGLVNFTTNTICIRRRRQCLRQESHQVLRHVPARYPRRPSVHVDHFGVDYRRHSLPMGSGTVTGILTREYNSISAGRWALSRSVTSPRRRSPSTLRARTASARCSSSGPVSNPPDSRRA